MSERVRTTVHERLEDALDAAWRASDVGDTILFSPGFASFDQFPNFTLRAARFGRWVRELQTQREESLPQNTDASPPSG